MEHEYLTRDWSQCIPDDQPETEIFIPSLAADGEDERWNQRQKELDDEHANELDERHPRTGSHYRRRI